MASNLTPHRDFSAASCRELVKALDQAIETFAGWGVRIPDQAAFHAARQWLADLGNRTDIELTVAELEKTSKHCALAVDLYHISTTLGDEPNPLIAFELAQIVRGSPSTTESVQNFLSQFWVGALLAQSKLKPGIDTRKGVEGTRPDFLAEWGTLGFLVEVKCPKSEKSAFRALSSAASQLRGKTQPGVIFVDATYALGINPFACTSPNDLARLRYKVGNSSLHDQMKAHIDTYRQSDKFDRVILLVTFSRFWSWVLPKPCSTRCWARFHGGGLAAGLSRPRNPSSRRVSECSSTRCRATDWKPTIGLKEIISSSPNPTAAQLAAAADRTDRSAHRGLSGASCAPNHRQRSLPCAPEP